MKFNPSAAIGGAFKRATPSSSSSGGKSVKNYQDELRLELWKDKIRTRDWWRKYRIKEGDIERRRREDEARRKAEKDAAAAKAKLDRARQTSWDSGEALLNAWEKVRDDRKSKFEDAGDKYSFPPPIDLIRTIYTDSLSLGSPARARLKAMGYGWHKAGLQDEDAGFGQDPVSKKFYSKDNKDGFFTRPDAKNGGFQSKSNQHDWDVAATQLNFDKSLVERLIGYKKLGESDQADRSMGFLRWEAGSPIFDLSTPAGKSSQAAYERYTQARQFRSPLLFYKQNKFETEVALKNNKEKPSASDVAKTLTTKIAKVKATVSSVAPYWAKTKDWKETSVAKGEGSAHSIVFGRNDESEDFTVYDITEYRGYDKFLEKFSKETDEGKDDIITSVLAEARNHPIEVRKKILAVAAFRLAGARGKDHKSLSAVFNAKVQFANKLPKTAADRTNYNTAKQIVTNPKGDEQGELVSETRAALEELMNDPQYFMEEFNSESATHFYSRPSAATLEAEKITKQNNQQAPKGFVEKFKEGLSHKEGVAQVVAHLKNPAQASAATLELSDYSHQVWVDAAKSIGYLKDNKTIKNATDIGAKAATIFGIFKGKATEAADAKKVLTEIGIENEQNTAANVVQLKVHNSASFLGTKLPTMPNRQGARKALESILEKAHGTKMPATEIQIDKRMLVEWEKVLRSFRDPPEEGKGGWADRVRKMIMSENIGKFMRLAESLKHHEPLSPYSVVQVDSEKRFPLLGSFSPELKNHLKKMVEQQKQSLKVKENKGLVKIRQSVGPDGEPIFFAEAKTPITQEQANKTAGFTKDPNAQRYPNANGKLVAEDLRSITSGAAAIPAKFFNHTEQYRIVVSGNAEEKARKTQAIAKYLYDGRKMVEMYNLGQKYNGKVVTAESIADYLMQETEGSEPFQKHLQTSESVLGFAASLFHIEMLQSAEITTEDGRTTIQYSPRYKEVTDPEELYKIEKSALVQDANHILKTAPVAQILLKGMEGSTSRVGRAALRMDKLPKRMRDVLSEALTSAIASKDKKILEVIENLKNSKDKDDVALGEDIESYASQLGLRRTSIEASLVDRIIAKIQAFGSGITGYISNASDSNLKSLELGSFLVKDPKSGAEIINREGRAKFLNTKREVANNDLKKVLEDSDKTAQQKWEAMQAAQRTFYAIALTYHFAGMVQGGSGGRAISNEDFENMYRALWGPGGDLAEGSISAAKLVIADTINRAMIINAVKHRGLKMIQHVFFPTIKFQGQMHVHQQNTIARKQRRALELSDIVPAATRQQHNENFSRWMSKDANNIPNKSSVSSLSTLIQAKDRHVWGDWSDMLGKKTFKSEEEIPTAYTRPEGFKVLFKDIQDHLRAKGTDEAIVKQYPNMFVSMLGRMVADRGANLRYDGIPLTKWFDLNAQESAAVAAGTMKKSEATAHPVIKLFVQDVVNQMLYSKVKGEEQ